MVALIILFLLSCALCSVMPPCERSSMIPRSFHHRVRWLPRRRIKRGRRVYNPPSSSLPESFHPVLGQGSIYHNTNQLARRSCSFLKRFPVCVECFCPAFGSLAVKQHNITLWSVILRLSGWTRSRVCPLSARSFSRITIISIHSPDRPLPHPYTFFHP